MSSTTVDPPGTAPVAGSDVFAEVLVAVSNQLRRAVNVPTFALDDGRLQDRLTQALAVRAGVEELVARLVREVDDRDLATRAGASSTRAHLQATHRMSRSQAAGITAQANAVCDRTETTRRAWAAGAISGEQAVVIGQAINRLSPGVDAATVGLAQLDLVEHARACQRSCVRA